MSLIIASGLKRILYYILQIDNSKAVFLFNCTNLLQTSMLLKLVNLDFPNPDNPKKLVLPKEG